MTTIQSMLYKVMDSVTADGSEMVFVSGDLVWKFYHAQDCCENVYIEDICGDLQDLVGVPLVVAEEVSNVDTPEGTLESIVSRCDSYTWTFYRFATVKGTITVRWLGTSNGYYSESVSIEEPK